MRTLTYREHRVSTLYNEPRRYDSTLANGTEVSVFLFFKIKIAFVRIELE